ncbi:MAG: peptidoglycan-associated lipoprotein [Polaribacter sp.]|jgi:peptidoglycan-associated lipoprotein
MRSLTIIFLFTLTSIVSAWAQPIRTATSDAMLKEAEKKMEMNDYYNALDLYEKAYKMLKKQKKTRGDNELAYTIANLHYRLRDFRKAERWYSRVINKRYRKGSNPFLPDARFTLGRILKMNGKYIEAIEELRLYISVAENADLIAKAKIELEGAQLAMPMQDITGMVVENAGKKVNSKYSEYSPVLVGNQMYFTAIRSDEVIVVDEKTEGQYAQVYTSSMSEDKWSEAVLLENENIHRDGFHIGNLAMSKNGETMYFTRAKLDGNIIGESKIYQSRMSDDGWGPANEVEGINGDYVAKQAAPGELFGEQVLFFISNMEGGYGGFDIYYSPKRGETYGPPVNLGNTVNTVDDEETPFYRDGILYFSSNGFPTIGGSDIFKSVWDGSNWAAPENMGKPYNSPVDDLYFSLDDTGYKGFVVSNREGGRSVKSKTCCDDIWTIDIAEVVIDLMATTFADDKSALAGVTLELISNQDGTMGETNKKTNPAANNFAFTLAEEMAYIVIASKEGYISDTTEFNTAGLEVSTTIEKKMNLVFIPPPPEDPYETYEVNEPIELGNIYYDFNRASIKTEAEPDLTFLIELMTEYPEMVIELSSHTDAQGRDKYNEMLSQRRAQSAMDWMTKKGIAPARIKPVGYGEKQIRNQCTNDVECTDEEHQYNRRTEFKILEGPTSIRIEKTRLKKKTTEK